VGPSSLNITVVVEWWWLAFVTGLFGLNGVAFKKTIARQFTNVQIGGQHDFWAVLTTAASLTGILLAHKSHSDNLDPKARIYSRPVFVDHQFVSKRIASVYPPSHDQHAVIPYVSPPPYLLLACSLPSSPSCNYHVLL
jgi:hypothetical protein